MSVLTLDQPSALGRLVAAGRMLAGLDQAALAQEAGVSASTVSNVERGQDAREDTLKALRNALKRLGVVNHHDRTNGAISLSVRYDDSDDED